jgi:succinoglycan biosynthesis protein ExoA
MPSPLPLTPVASASLTPLLSLSVIVPVRNEASHIQHTLRQLLAQDYPPGRFEILVVDGQSTDATPDLVRQIAQHHPNVQLLKNPKKLSSSARNIGIRHARGQAVLIVDGHCEIPARNMLRNVSDAFISSGAHCLGRPQPLTVTGATTLQKAIAAARASRLGHHPESFIYAGRPQFAPAKSVAVAYRREVFASIGYFDEHFDAHEDGELNHRCDAAGLACYFTPDIAVNYFPRTSLLGLYRQMIRYGRGRVRFSRKHPGTSGLGALVPALFVLYILLGPLLAALAALAWSISAAPLALPSSITDALVLSYLAGLALYAATIAIFSAAIATEKREPLFLLLLPPVFAAIHLGAGAGILIESIAPKNPAPTQPQLSP